MPICRHCASEFPNHAVLDGVRHNLGRRKFCLICSPFGSHNTKKSLALTSTLADTIVSDQWDGQTRVLYRRVCGTCGSETYRPKKSIRVVNYCSQKCSAKAQDTKISCLCAWCGNSVRVRPARLETSKSGLVFCSKGCKDRAQSLSGLQTSWPPHFGTAGDESTYRERALRAYGEKCDGCGYEGDKRFLDVHHRDHNHSNHGLENLQVLCVCCHGIVTRRHLSKIPNNISGPSGPFMVRCS